MLKNVSDPKIILQMLLSLLSTSGTMAGISLALVGIVKQTFPQKSAIPARAASSPARRCL
jgi:hypothetical protein